MLEAIQRYIERGKVIGQKFLLLEKKPEIGWPFPELPELRELV
jgi:hypothetical protein